MLYNVVVVSAVHQLKKKKKLGIKLPYDPAIPLPHTSPKKITVLKDTCIPRVTAALLLYF